MDAETEEGGGRGGLWGMLIRIQWGIGLERNGTEQYRTERVMVGLLTTKRSSRRRQTILPHLMSQPRLRTAVFEKEDVVDAFHEWLWNV